MCKFSAILYTTRNFSYFSFHEVRTFKMKNGILLKVCYIKAKKAEKSCTALKDDQQKVIDDMKAVSEMFNNFFHKYW